VNARLVSSSPACPARNAQSLAFARYLATKFMPSKWPEKPPLQRDRSMKC
jgi:hypothetical protein